MTRRQAAPSRILGSGSCGGDGALPDITRPATCDAVNIPAAYCSTIIGIDCCPAIAASSLGQAGFMGHRRYMKDIMTTPYTPPPNVPTLAPRDAA